MKRSDHFKTLFGTFFIKNPISISQFMSLGKKTRPVHKVMLIVITWFLFNPNSIAHSFHDELGEIIHIVKKGDTLFSIARQYRTSVAELTSINELTKEELRIGKIIKVVRRDR